MNVPDIVILALKVLGCALGIYVVGGFLVSFKRLSALLATASSVVTLIAVSRIQTLGDASLLWQPVVLSLLTQLFYRGESYLNPRVHENLFEIVSVQRKYTSFFSDFDDYEVHFSPVKIGGFVENTIFLGILFFLYYNFLIFSPNNSDAVFIVPLYYGLMSVIDLLASIGILRLPYFLYWSARILMIILAFFLALASPFQTTVGKDAKMTKIYNECLPLMVYDFDNSYRATYEYSTMSNKGYDVKDLETVYFIYDSNLGVAAEYEDISKGRMYPKVYIEDENDSNKAYAYQNNAYNGLEFEYAYFNTVENVGGAFRYGDPTPFDFSVFLDFTLEKLLHIGGTPVDYIEGENLMKIEYISRNDSTYVPIAGVDEYSVAWVFRTDKKDNPIALSQVYCTVYTGGTERHFFDYASLADSSTGLSAVLNSDGSLKGYTYSDKEVYGTNLQQKLDALNGVNGSISDFDFYFKKYTDGEPEGYYVYDKDTKTVAVFKDNFKNGEEARIYNDYVTYKPDYFVNNVEYAKYSASGELLGTASDSNFKLFTFDDHVTATAIMNAFSADFNIEEAEFCVFPGGGSAEVSYTSMSHTLGVDITYVVNFQCFSSSRRYYLYSYSVQFSYGGSEYTFIFHASDNAFRITVPVP